MKIDFDAFSLVIAKKTLGILKTPENQFTDKKMLNKIRNGFYEIAVNGNLYGSRFYKFFWEKTY